MTDQTPDPFEQFHTQECAGNFLTIDGYTQRCDCGLDAALAAERAQHQQEIAKRDETIRQLQDAFARCQEVQQATAETWRIEHDQMAEQIRLLRGAMAADDERLRRAAEQAGILYVSCDTAEALAEQIARLSAQVRKLEAELALARSAGSRDLNLRMNEANKALRAERDAAQQQIEAVVSALAERNRGLRGAEPSRANLVELITRISDADVRKGNELLAAQQQIATLTQELSVSRANHIDANQRNMQSVRELEAAEARCATLISGLQDILTADDTSTLAGAVAIAQATLEKASR